MRECGLMNQESCVMHHLDGPSFEYWILIGVFFFLFAICGFNKKTRHGGCGPCHFIAIGFIIMAINCVVLMGANRIGYDEFNLLRLITLKTATIESSFIVLGYCLMIQGIAMFLKKLFIPSLRTYL